MTAARKIMRAMHGQSIGVSYARQALGMKSVTFHKSIDGLRATGMVEVTGARGDGWEYGLTDAGKQELMAAG